MLVGCGRDGAIDLVTDPYARDVVMVDFGKLTDSLINYSVAQSLLICASCTVAIGHPV